MTDEVNKISIKLADIDHIDALCRLYENCKKALLEKNIFQWTSHYPTPGMFEKDIEQKNFFIASFTGKIIAAIVLNQQIPDELSIIEWNVAAERSVLVERLAVHPDYFGKGIGKKMMKFAEEKALENNALAIRLQVYQPNKRAKAFYQKLGYYCLGGLFYKGWESPFYCFEKQLTKLNK